MCRFPESRVGEVVRHRALTRRCRASAAAVVGIALAGCSAAAWNGRVERWGTLRSVLRDGDVSAKVELAAVGGSPNVVGLGALADLHGEVTICDGLAWVARPRADAGVSVTRGARAADRAAFLVLAMVPAWRATPWPTALQWEGLEPAIASAIDDAGLASLDTVPFVVEGEFRSLDAHVLNGRCPFATAPERRGEPVRFERATARGRLVGFFTSLAPGTLTHHGSRLHVHVILEGPDAPSGHVDRVELAPGAVLRLPQR